MFNFENEVEKKAYLSEAKIYQEVEFESVVYDATEYGEFFDINLKVEGVNFRDRSFGTTLESVFVGRVYENGQPREETKEEAFQRHYRNIYFKLRYLGMCVGTLDEFNAACGKFNDLKDLVDKFNKFIEGKEFPKLNVAIMWKHNNNKQTSNLVLAERIQWVEVTQYSEGKIVEPKLKYTNYQIENNLTPKYTFGSKPVENTDSTILDSNNTDASNNVPF